MRGIQYRYLGVRYIFCSRRADIIISIIKSMTSMQEEKEEKKAVAAPTEEPKDKDLPAPAPVQQMQTSEVRPVPRPFKRKLKVSPAVMNRRYKKLQEVSCAF